MLARRRDIGAFELTTSFASCLLLRLVDDYNDAMNGVKRRLVRKSVPNQLTYIGELLQGTQFSPKMVI